MKKCVLIHVAAIMFSCNTTQKLAETPAPSTETLETPPSVSEIPMGNSKKFIQDYFEETYLLLGNATKGLSDEQLKFKAAPERW